MRRSQAKRGDRADLTDTPTGEPLRVSLGRAGPKYASRTSGEARRLLAKCGKEFVEALLEGRHTFVLELLGDLVHVDTEAGQGLDHRMGFLNALVNGSSHRAVLLEGLEGVVGQCVHRVGADQLVDIQRVGVVGVLR